MELMKVQHCEASFLEMQEYEAYFTSMSPSQQTIAGFYLADFWEKEKFFTHCMAAISEWMTMICRVLTMMFG